MTEEELQTLEVKLGHHFQHPGGLETALTHRSWRNGAGSEAVDYERMEFLGDRVLGLVVSDYLARTFPEWEVGTLSKGLARLVSAPAIQAAAQSLDLGRHLRLGRGEELTGGREKRNLLSDAYEAVVAAIYLDAGLEAAAGFVRRSLLDPALAAEVTTLGEADHKSALQEWLQQRGMGPVEYRIVRQTGPEHRKTFSVELWLGNARRSEAQGMTKKEAEQAAARVALQQLRTGPGEKQEAK